MAGSDLRRRNMAIGVALVCLTALIVFLNTRSRPEPEIPISPPEVVVDMEQTPSEPLPHPGSFSMETEADEIGIDPISASPEFRASSLTVPTEPVRIHPHYDMLSIIPADTHFAIHTPSLNSALDGVIAFVTSSIASDEARQLDRDLRGEFDEFRERGMNTDGPTIVFLAGEVGPGAGWGRAAWILEIEDLDLFQQHWDSRSPQEMVMGHPTWLEAGRYQGAASVVGRYGIEVVESQPVEWMYDLLRPQPRAQVADAFDDVNEGTIALGIDTALLANSLRPVVESAAEQWQSQLTEGRLNMSGEQLVLSQMLVTHRDMLMNLMESAAPVEIRFTPTAEAIDVQVRAALAGSDHHRGGGARSGPLTLAHRLPDGAMLALDTARPGTEGEAILNLFHSTLVELLAGEDREMRAALSETGSELILDHSRGREFALAIYRSTFGDVWPRRVVMVRFPSDRSVHEALRRLQAQADVEIWRAIPATRLSARVEQPEEVEGQQVAHIVFSGAALDEIRDLTDPDVLLASPALALIGPPGEVHHWAGQMGDTLIFTTEPRPELMAEILRGEAEGLALPPEAAPVLEDVDFALHVRWSQVIGWNQDLEEGVGDTQNRARQHEHFSGVLAEYERSLWIGVEMWSGGFEAHSIWPPFNLWRFFNEAGFNG